MNAAILLEEAVALALKLAPRERLQLIERVAASVKNELETATVEPGQPGEHWGQNLIRLLDETRPVELIHPEIEDATEWVKQIRRDQEAQRGLNWDDAECPGLHTIPVPIMQRGGRCEGRGCCPSVRNSARGEQ